MSKPVAVLIADIHYSINTLQLADAAMRMAINKANDLRVPLVVAGDLHDTKANLRGECVNAMLETFKQCSSPPYILVGNHCRLNEKAPEHSLNFLAAYAAIIDYRPSPIHKLGYLIPYAHDPYELRDYLKTLPKDSQLIMHQGLKNTNSGHYIQDKSAISHADVQDFRVISGHYHARQDIITSIMGHRTHGMTGVFSYIGNPYTLNYAEANDPPKGFQILMDDGTLEFVPTYLRRHQVIERTVESLETKGHATIWNIDDLFWVKVTGSREQLAKLSKENIARNTGMLGSFRLDLIPTDVTSQVFESKNLTQGELLDSLISSLTDTSDERKLRLKDKWKSYANN